MIRLLTAVIAGAAMLMTRPAAGVEYMPLHQQLTVAALAMSEELDPSDHVADWLRFYMPGLQRELESGEVDREEAERRALADLRRRVAEFDREVPLTFETSVFFRQYEADAEGFRLGALFQERYFMAAEPNAGTLPKAYLVLFANADLTEHLPMSREKAETFEARRMQLRGSSKRRLGARVSYRLIRCQNGRDFQAVISRVELYGSPDMKERLHVFEEQRDFQELVDERLLSEGVTWNVQENHGFNYAGLRLLAVLPENHPDYGDCRPLDGRVAGHRQVRCMIERRGRGLPERVERLYVGGRLVRATLHRGEEIPDSGLRGLYFELRGMGLEDASERQEPATWQYGGAVLHFRPCALSADSGQTGYLVVEAAPFVELKSRDGGDDSPGVKAAPGGEEGP